MARIFCPECKASISETAFSCPKCGHQMNDEEVERGRHKKEAHDNRKNRLIMGGGVISIIIMLIPLIYVIEHFQQLREAEGYTKSEKQLIEAIAKVEAENLHDVPGYGDASHIDQVIESLGEPDYINHDGLYSCAGYRDRGLVICYTHDRKITGVDIHQKPAFKSEELVSFKYEMIAGQGLKCTTMGGEIISIDFDTHRNDIRAYFGFPDKRKVIEGYTYRYADGDLFPALEESYFDSLIFERYSHIGTTFIYNEDDKCLKDWQRANIEF